MAFTIIDDRDSAVTYTGTWVPGGTTHEHAGTVSSSVKVGDHFSVQFTGTAIAVYGTFDASSAGVKTSYAIDGGAATPITSGSSPLDSFQQLFWQSEAVPNGSHDLFVTMLAVNNVGDGEGTIWFDYFNVTTDATSPTSSSSSTSSPAASPAQASNTASSPMSSGTAVAATIAKKASHSALIGGVTAGVLVFLFAAGLLLLGLRRKRKYDNLGTPPGMSSNSIIPPSSKAPTAPASDLPGPEPMRTASSFAPATYPAVPGAPTGSAAPGPIPPHTHNAYAPLPTYMLDSTPPQSSYAPSESSTSQYTNRGPLSVVGGSSTAGSDSIADLKRRQQEVVNSYEEGISGVPPVQHVDSGVRKLVPATGAADGSSELPPVYTPN